jgi:hypothetical protein
MTPLANAWSLICFDTPIGLSIIKATLIVSNTAGLTINTVLLT